MLVIDNIEALRRQLTAWKRAGERIAFVPTMGNLHDGHASLFEQAREHGTKVVASIYVNPMQFGLNEDWSKYPRTLDADCSVLRDKKVDALFLPDDQTMYPADMALQTYVEVPRLSDVLCGASRPGHFRGVATVVSKLFNLVQPDVAIFGEKDFQQLMVIRQMVRDLFLPIQIIGAPTLRAADGLALSSRNGYLSAEERAMAPIIHATLAWCEQELTRGRQDFEMLEQEAGARINQVGLRTDYFAIRRARDLQLPESGERELVALAAAYLGRARLIDNQQISR